MCERILGIRLWSDGQADRLQFADVRSSLAVRQTRKTKITLLISYDHNMNPGDKQRAQNRTAAANYKSDAAASEVRARLASQNYDYLDNSYLIPHVGNACFLRSSRTSDIIYALVYLVVTAVVC